MHSNGNSFGSAGTDLGGSNTYGQSGDGSRPASASWLFAVTVFRL